MSSDNPGKKIDFLAHKVDTQFPDQFEPWKVLGSTLTSRFNATLFRFPLRTPEQVIKNENHLL